MKKLITIILILALLLPAAAPAEDQEPIVGCWYVYYSKAVTPELATSYQNYDRVIAVYIFNADGTITCLEHDYKEGGTDLPMYNSAGKWGHEGNDYKYSIIGLGEGKAFVKDGFIYLGIQNNMFYLKLRWLYPFNPYQDYDYTVH